jgi:dihydrofolate reductase
MGRVVYYAAMSLDGYIAEADDTLEWLTGFQAVPPADGVQTFDDGYDEFYEEVGALVSGSVTYEWLLGHMARGGSWPYTGMPYWVLSSRELEQPEGVDVTVVNASVTDLFDEMMAAAGDRKLWVVGGGNVASQFADAGLLEDVWVTVVPVALGTGKPLFDRRLPGAPMRLTAALPRPSGMIELRFEVRAS